MKLREGKISITSLVIATSITILLMFLELNSKSKVPSAYYQEKKEAAELTLKALKAVKEAVNERHIPIDRINDPNETGLIGLQYSPLTTERSDISAKLTSTNPNFAALIVQLIKNSGAKEGDVIAVSLTGSYPALNIAVLSALKILKLNPIIITSVSSSMWGANYPEWTYLDIAAVLSQKGLIEFETAAASIGGEDDIGRGLSPGGREIIKTAMLRNKVPSLEAGNLEDAIKKRYNIYTNGRKVRLFINVAEHTTALAGIDITSGLIRPRHIKSGKGIIAQFSRSGIPVINIIDINSIAQEYGLPIAPIPLPNVGEGKLYSVFRYSVSQAIISLAILLVILFIVLRFDINYYLQRRKT